MSKYKIENIKNSLLEEKNNFVPARTSTLPEQKVEAILDDVKKAYELNSHEEAITVVALLFQQGGTARGCDGNMTISILGKTIKLAEIRKILKQNSCAKAERKLARTIATEIHQVAELMGIPGNLYTKIQKNHLETKFDDTQKFWMSDFQSDNPNCPTEIRTLILETFKKKESNNKKKKK